MQKPKRKTRKHHVIMKMKPNQKLVVYDMYSRFDFELTLIEKGAGRLALDFNVPGTVRVARC